DPLSSRPLNACAYTKPLASLNDTTASLRIGGFSSIKVVSFVGHGGSDNSLLPAQKSPVRLHAGLGRSAERCPSLWLICAVRLIAPALSSARFPVNFPVSSEFDLETGSLETASTTTQSRSLARSTQPCRDRVMMLMIGDTAL